MKDNIKSIAVWAICVAAGNVLATAFVFLGALVSDAMHLTVRPFPGEAPTMLSQHMYLGLAGFLALFNVLMLSVLVLLLVWLVGSATVLLVSALRNLYLRQDHLRSL